MSYELTREQVCSITTVDVAFPTAKLLPKEDEIPKEFFNGNIYTEVAENYFYGLNPPKGVIVMKQDITTEEMIRCVDAHIKSFGPRHEHKIAGVGYMISKMCEITPE